MKKQRKNTKPSISSWPLYAWFVTLTCLIISQDTNVIAQSDEKRLAGYSVIIIEKVEIAQTTATEKFPKGYDTALQLKIIDELKKTNYFTKVINGAKKESDRSTAPEPAPADDERRLKLSSQIIAFDPGSRNQRIAIGLGLGSAKVKVKFVFRDADNDLDELIILTQEGRFGNFTEVFDPDKNVVVTGASSEVVEGLVRVIKKNR